MLFRSGPVRAAVIAGAVSALAVVGTAGCVIAALALSSSDHLPSLAVIAVTYLPLAAVEAVVGGFVVSFLVRVKPEVLGRTVVEAAA